MFYQISIKLRTSDMNIDSSKFGTVPKRGNIDGCGRGVCTSIGTLASTIAHPSVQ